MVVYGVCIRFWPTLFMWVLRLCMWFKGCACGFKAMHVAFAQLV